VYWSGAGWWGFGLGATAAPWGERQARPRTREAYRAWLEDLEAGAVPEPAARPEDGRERLGDRLLVGLRRREGVHLPQLLAEAGLASPLQAAAIGDVRRVLADWRAEGLLVEQGPRWRLSDPAGLALSNAVLRRWLAWWEAWSGASPDRRSSAAAPPPPGSVPAAGAG